MQRRIGSFLQGVQSLVLSITKFCGRGRVPCSACEGEEKTEKLLEEVILKLGHEISLGFSFLIYKTRGMN